MSNKSLAFVCDYDNLDLVKSTPVFKVNGAVLSNDIADTVALSSTFGFSNDFRNGVCHLAHEFADGIQNVPTVLNHCLIECLEESLDELQYLEGVFSGRSMYGFLTNPIIYMIEEEEVTVDYLEGMTWAANIIAMSVLEA